MATANSADLARPKQNWIVDPVSDGVFIIAAPLLAFVWSLLTLQAFGSEFLWTVFSIFNVAHHLPTFIRIYGDKDCFSRFKWSLLLGPIIPFFAAVALAYYTLSNGYPISTLFMIMMILTVWDPWHFLMQHYGFMRIYDRHNAAPRRLAAWMDYSVSLAWFAYIMMATGEWLFEGVLHRMFVDSGIPFLLWLNPELYQAILNVALGFAVASTCGYAVYVLWCFRKGYFISPAKLMLLVMTFAMMYITYVPTSFLRAYFPNWTYQVGFATLGMVHVTQYLAIVWKFNRGLASRGEDRSRQGVFSYAFSKGGLIIAAGYVAICLVYGALLNNQSLRISEDDTNLSAYTIVASLIVCISFTSTLMHYYYDGFIWKLRHKENTENLSDGPVKQKESQASWWERIGTGSIWERFKANTFAATLVRQACYFGLPIGLLTLTFFYAGQMQRDAAHNPADMDGLVKVSERYFSDPTPANLEIARNLIRNLDRQIKAEQRMIELNPASRVGHEVELAFLIYSRAWGTLKFLITPEREATPEELETYREQLREAIALLEKNFDPRLEPQGEMQVQMKFHWDSWNQQLSQIP